MSTRSVEAYDLPPETELSRAFTLQLIPSAYFQPPILRSLVDADDEVAVLQAIERKTSKRLSQREINPDFQDWGSSCIEAPALDPNRTLPKLNGRSAKCLWGSPYPMARSLYPPAVEHVPEQPLEALAISQPRRYRRIVHHGAHQLVPIALTAVAAEMFANELIECSNALRTSFSWPPAERNIDSRERMVTSVSLSIQA